MTSKSTSLVTEFRASHGGVTAYVQSKVHSTNIGPEATSIFLECLIVELENAITSIIQPVLQEDSHLNSNDEVEVGTLVSAASLTIRYTTERNCLLPYLARYIGVFQYLLDINRSDMAFLGLKAVALIGFTRVLESYGEEVELDTVEMLIVKLFTQFDYNEDSPNDTFATLLNCLFCPACEFLSVAMQTHDKIESIVYLKILPKLIILIQTIQALGILSETQPNGNEKIQLAIAVELVSTISIFLKAKLPVLHTSAFSLIPMPEFIHADIDASPMELEQKILENPMHTSSEILQLLQLNSKDGNSQIILEEMCRVLCCWLELRNEALVSPSTLLISLACQTMQILHDISQNHSVQRTPHPENIILAGNLINQLKSNDLNSLNDLLICKSLLEAIYNVMLNIPYLPRENLLIVEDVVEEVMHGLKTAVQHASRRYGSSTEAYKQIKQESSKLRDVLVYIYVTWMHRGGGDIWLAKSTDSDNLAFVPDYIGIVKLLTDPRISADAVFVWRKHLQHKDFVQIVQVLTHNLILAVEQLDRYSKIVVKKLLSAVGRVAIASKEYIEPYSENLVRPILNSAILIKSSKTRQSNSSYILHLEAIACVLFSSCQDQLFLSKHMSWVDEYLILLYQGAAEECSGPLLILNGLSRQDNKLKAYIASLWIKSITNDNDTIPQLPIHILDRWPLYVEDEEFALLFLDTLQNLAPFFQQHMSPNQINYVLGKINILLKNASTDDNNEIVDACKEVCKATKQQIPLDDIAYNYVYLD